MVVTFEAVVLFIEASRRQISYGFGPTKVETVSPLAYSINLLVALVLRMNWPSEKVTDFPVGRASHAELFGSFALRDPVWRERESIFHVLSPPLS
jgi:hypothetical protein